MSSGAARCRNRVDGRRGMGAASRGERTGRHARIAADGSRFRADEVNGVRPLPGSAYRKGSDKTSPGRVRDADRPPVAGQSGRKRPALAKAGTAAAPCSHGSRDRGSHCGWRPTMPDRSCCLYLPICSATSARPMTWATSPEPRRIHCEPSAIRKPSPAATNIVHMHRLRALCDAVLVGSGTVAADDPLLTTRHVPGANPLRVVFDPRRRLTPAFRVFTDRTAPTLYICAGSRMSPGESHMGCAVMAAIDEGEPGDEVAQALRLLHARGCARVLVEGGGVTVSRFLEANLLDRLQIAIAPVLIGDGRPAVRLLPQVRLRDCRRPGYRVFRMGGDVLFELRFEPQGRDAAGHRSRHRDQDNLDSICPDASAATTR